MSSWRSRATCRIAIACTLAVPLLTQAAWSDNVVGSVTAPAREGPGAFRHLQALQEVANANGNNRAAGSSGYDRSADYVAARLRDAGYAVRFEEFDFPFFEEREPPVLQSGGPDGPLERAAGSSLRTLGNSGSADVTAPLRAVNLQLADGAPPASTSGCHADDFKTFDRGGIALLRRGTCPFQVKVDNAVAAGAAGAIIMNEGVDGRTANFAGQLAKPAAIPVLGVPYDFGRTLAATAQAGGQVRLAINAEHGRRSTRNVIAETAVRTGPLVITGAHLDSVTEGPGMNDNGSGSAAVLEAALQLAKDVTQSRVRIAFWGAEENGLLGSRHHVAALSDAELKDIALYINLDMVGSTNFVRYVQGPDLGGVAAAARHELLAAFREHGLPVEERGGTRFGSDDAAFSQKKVPTVGLYTGAGALKTEAQAKTFGGVAGKPYDACYHRACDTIDNIDRDALEQSTQALVRAVRAVTMPTANAPKPAAVPESRQ